MTCLGRLSLGWPGVVFLGVLLAAWSLSGLVRDGLRERALDFLLPHPRAAKAGVVIVDIDRTALAHFGPWPWPRAGLARIVEMIADAKPAALGVDILLAGPDRFSPAALLNMLPEGVRGELMSLLPRLPDGDAALARAFAKMPTALGYVLEEGRAGKDLPAVPVLLRAPPRLPGLWRADGAVGPDSPLVDAVQGLGTLAIAADADGPVRRVPLMVLTGDRLRPGLVVELVRLAQGAGQLIIDGDARLRIGDVAVPLGSDAELWLFQPLPSSWSVQTVPLTQLFDDPKAHALLADQIVLIGASAPELAGLRATPASPATPSVQIQAEAVATLLSGNVAWRPPWLEAAEVACAAMLGLVVLIFAARWRPLPAAILALLACLALQS
jgi:adenylate cyclase